MIKVLTILGTRPEAIKLAPVIRELREYNDIFQSCVCVTAQHREMLDQVLAWFGIVPDYDLDLMEENQGLAEFASQALVGISETLKEARPDVVLVQGDTTTVMMAALAAFYQRIPLGHIEAGLRTRDLYNPFPEEFNRLCDEHGTKGAALSHVTLGLAAELSRPLGAEPISVLCDKHGGRNRYADLLADHFPDHFIEIHGESRARSIYRFGPPDRRIEFRFQTKGESYLQAALASMASKYLRELAMRAFNHFWCSRVPDLKPTAGYPQDARRFKAAIAGVQAKLGIEDDALWRRR